MPSVEEEIYDVEAIVKHRILKGKKQYLIKWLGYPSSQNTWEDEDNIFCEELKRAYEDSISQPKPAKKAQKFEQAVTNEWGAIVKEVIGVSKGENNQLEVEYLTVDGRRCICTSDEIHIKAPIHLLKFYEQNLSFPE